MDELIFYVDIPKLPDERDPDNNQWQSVRQFDSRAAAIAYAKEQFGADDNGCVCLITG